MLFWKRHTGCGARCPRSRGQSTAPRREPLLVWLCYRTDHVFDSRNLPNKDQVGRRRLNGELPLIHRLALIYLALPLAVWLLGWLKWWVGAPATLALALALWGALRGSWRWSISRTRMGVALVAAAWVLIVPSGGVVGDAGDWQVFHRSIFLDLVRAGPPTYLADHLLDEEVLLRYHLGYHMVPALLGRWFGPAALNWAVPLWTWCGVALVLALFVHGLSRSRAVAVALLVVVFFSGLDAVEYALRWLLFNEGGVQSWGGFHGMLVSGFWFVGSPDSPLMLEYQSHAHTLGNSPQHFITAGLGTLLLVQSRRCARLVGVSGVVLAACLFWSSLLSIGLLPLAAALALGNGLRPLLTWQNLLVAPALAALVGLYLTSGKTDFPAGWLWTLYGSGARLAADIAILYASEFLLLALLLWRLRSKLARDPCFLASIVVLLAAPWWWYGSPVFSELTVRVTLPAVFVLSYHVARVLAAHVAGLSGLGRTAPHATRRAAPSRALVGIVCLLAVGAVSTTAFYIGMLGRQHGPRYERAGYSLLVEAYTEAAIQRTARRVSGLFAALLPDPVDGETTAPSKGDLLFQSAARPLYEVYQMDSRLLFVTRRVCRRVPRETTQFQVRVHPAERDALPPDRRPLGFEVLDFTSRSITEHKGGHNCVWARRLPWYDIERVVAAQRTDGDLRWMAEFLFAGGRHTATNTLFDDTATTFAAEYAALSAQQSAARGPWNVYLRDGRIAYAKQPCAWADGQPRFFVHVFPDQAADLPERRRGSGFDNLDFRFDRRGVLFDGKCLVRRALPDYAIRHVRTGQFKETGEVLWSVEVALQDAEATP